MNEQQIDHKQSMEKEAMRLHKWERVLAILFRVMIIIGLALLVLVIVLLFVMDTFRGWILMVPFILIATGILLVWLEYRLHLRVYALNETQKAEYKAPDNSGIS